LASHAQEEICHRFEAGWREGRRPRIEDFLSDACSAVLPDAKRRLLAQLVVLDLEYRWGEPARPPSPAEPTDGLPPLPDRPRLEDYLLRYPALGPIQSLSMGLIADEYRLRQRKGDRPDHAEYVQRFGTERSELIAALEHVDRDLAAEAAAQAIPPAGLTPTVTFAPGAEPEPGTRVRYIGDYEILEQLDPGGMGIVYKARQISLDRIVALKLIKRGQLATAEEVGRFHNEAQLAANLDHPGIVPIFEIGKHEGQHYFSMAFVAGESLKQRVSRGPLPPDEAARVMQEVCEAVAHAHAQGVIHRDLKPANILLDQQGRPHVSDFGLAKRVASDSGLTVRDQYLGTPSYMSPEQADRQWDRVTEVSDVYSLGATLYELLTGRPPFQAATFGDTLHQVRNEEPVPPRRLNPKLPPDMETICLRCLEKDAGGRPASAHRVAAALRAFLEGRPLPADFKRVTRAERLWKWRRRNPTMATLVALSATLALVIAAGVPSGWALYEAANRRVLRQALDLAEEHAKAAERKALEARSMAQQSAREYKEAVDVFMIMRDLRQRCEAIQLADKALEQSPDDARLLQLRKDAIEKLRECLGKSKSPQKSAP
jgi:tRNA A-37 threonylcarbamoyl transferase component Bud32